MGDTRTADCGESLSLEPGGPLLDNPSLAVRIGSPPRGWGGLVQPLPVWCSVSVDYVRLLRQMFARLTNRVLPCVALSGLGMALALHPEAYAIGLSGVPPLRGCARIRDF